MTSLARLLTLLFLVTGLAPRVLWLQIPGSFLARVEIVSNTQGFRVRESLLRCLITTHSLGTNYRCWLGLPFFFFFSFFLNKCFKGVINRLVSFF